MKTITTTIIFSIFCLHVLGADIHPDTTAPKKPWKISKQEFLERYGKDDTSIALIHYFLSRRKTGMIATVAGVVFTAGLSMKLGNVVANSKRATNPRGDYSGVGAFFIVLFLISAIGYASFSMIVGIFLWIGYSRKKLWEALNNYFAGKGISAYLKKRIFRKMKTSSVSKESGNVDKIGW